MQNLIEKYFEECKGEILKNDNGEPVLNRNGLPVVINSKPVTITGLALALGFQSRQALLNYQGKKEFNDTIIKAKSRVEEYAETRLFDKDGVNGAKFSLEFNFRWNMSDSDTINSNAKIYNGIPANLIAPTFASVLFDINNYKYSEFVFPGGRGSTKSSFISLNVIDLIMRKDSVHACVLRQVANTLRSSVYQQVLWAISVLGLEDEFNCTVSPLEITRIKTGQKIYFRGADDPNKIKSIKVPFGYIGVVWFEELDQFSGEESVRKIEQSIIRGGDAAYKFKSFNPPKSAMNWVNKYIKTPRDSRLVIESTYLSVPHEWLGKSFINDAEFLKRTNLAAYENEYLGIANGTGGNVFDNVVIREITDSEIDNFDRIYNGIDWGWYPDPFAFTRMAYIASQHKLFIFDEYRCNKKSNEETANELKNRGITSDDVIICDSAENKSVADYRVFGLLAKPAEKGPGTVEYSMKWLQSLREIVIDNIRCPETAKEFLEYEYERDKDGNVMSGYPDKNNHSIDSVRYALNNIWKRKGR